MTNVYRIAGMNVAVTAMHADVFRLCEDYLAPDAVPDLSVATGPEDIRFERERSERDDLTEGRPVRLFTDGYLETLAVYRQIAEKAPFFGTFLFHGSCVAVDGQGYLFTAKSGTGKSTHVRLWRELLGDRAVMINDDKPLIRIRDGVPEVCGTPWDGKHRLSTNARVPLKAVCILERSAVNRIRRISAAEAFPTLLQQTYRPSDREATEKTMALLDAVASGAALWRLGCNMDISAAETAYGAMKG